MVRTMSSVKHTIRLFTRLISFPSVSSIILINLLLVFVSTFIIVFFYGITLNNCIIVSLLFLLETIGTSIIGKILTYNDFVFTFRRHMVASGMGLLLLVIMWALGGLLDYFSIPYHYDLLSFGLISGICIQFSFRILTMISIGTTHITRRAIANIIQPFLSIAYSFFIFPGLYLTFFVLDILFWLSFTALFLILINLPIFITLRVHGLSLFRGFTTVWLGNDSTNLEDKLNELAHRCHTFVDIIGFQDQITNEKIGLIINPGIHPGPFKNVGSSELPSKLIDSLKKDWKNVFVFHSTTTHAYNLPSKNELNKVIQEIKKKVSYLDFKNEMTTTPIVLTEDEIRCSAQLFNDIALITLSDLQSRFDDISMEVGMLAKCIGEKDKPYKITIVDSHSSICEISESINFQNPFSQKIINLVKKTSDKLDGMPQKKFLVGFGHEHIDIPVEQGYAPGGVTAIVFEIENKKFAYVSLDGNNMDPNFKKRLFDAIIETGISFCEIVTTDSHIVNGIIPKGMGYSPIGQEGDKEYVISIVLKAIKNAIEQLTPAKYGWLRIDLETNVIGGENIQKLTTGISVSAKIAKYFLLTIIPFNLIFSLLLYIALMI